jgi:plastocyanin
LEHLQSYKTSICFYYLLMVCLLLLSILVVVVQGATQSFSVTNNGFSAWTFSGAATGDNPSISATVGDTLVFSINAPGHSFAIHIAPGQPFGTEWTMGVSGQPTASGVVTFVIPANTPPTLYYQCEFHSLMTGSIAISGIASATSTVSQATSTAVSVAQTTTLPQTTKVAQTTSVSPTSTPASGLQVIVDVGIGGAPSFSPSSVNVNLGDSVLFRFQSSGHTIDSMTAPGSCSFTSNFSSGGIVPIGQVFLLQISTSNGFTNNTIVPFGCAVHCGSGMYGAISVRSVISFPSPSISPLILAHLILMSLGFAFFTVIGIFVSSFRPFGDNWFNVHWIAQSIGFVLILAGFFIILAEVSMAGKSHFASLQGSPTSGTHPILGVIIVSFYVCQVVFGILSDRLWVSVTQSKPERVPTARAFSGIHRWFGRFILLLSVVQIYLGIHELSLPNWVYGIFTAWYGIWIVVVCILLAAGIIKFGGVSKVPPAQSKST